MTQPSEMLEQVADAFATRSPLRIEAGGSKTFLNPVVGEVVPAAQSGQAKTDSTINTLDLSQYSGVISYEPTELVITAKSGTPVSEIAKLLNEQGQELAFDPPLYRGSDTIGGVVACAVSGPSRVYRGGVRDYILGTNVINGRGEFLQFGGTVMKNVAGYDVSRLQVGARGALGVLMDLSVKVLPKHESQATTSFSYSHEDVRTRLRTLERQPLPLDAAALLPDASTSGVTLIVRFSGSDAAVQRALHDVGGDVMAPSEAEPFWVSLRDLEHPIFSGIKKNLPEVDSDSQLLWRFVLPADTQVSEFLNDLPDKKQSQWLFDWGGRLRWVRTSADQSTMRAIAHRFGGQVSVVGPQPESINDTKPDAAGIGDSNLQALDQLNQRIKSAFDPAFILNPGQWPFEAEPKHRPTVEPLQDSVTDSTVTG